MLFLFQLICHGVRDVADAQLDRGAVLDQVCDVPTDGGIGFGIGSNL